MLLHCISRLLLNVLTRMYENKIYLLLEVNANGERKITLIKKRMKVITIVNRKKKMIKR